MGTRGMVVGMTGIVMLRYLDPQFKTLYLCRRPYVSMYPDSAYAGLKVVPI